MTLQLPSDQLITVPFCGLGTPTDDFVLPPIIGSDGSLVQTQQFGIPPVQQQNPDFGGKPVLRTETNGVLQFYSNVLYFINQGGQFTFDAAQSTALGGYSTGAVLFNFPTSSYVISLIDNNTFNFVTTPSYIDGVHWAKLNKLAYPDIIDVGGLVTITGNNGLIVNSSANFVDNGLGPFVRITRDSTTLSSAFLLRILAEAPTSIIPGATHVAAIQIDGGTNDATLAADYSGTTHRWFSNAPPGNLNFITYAQALANLGDIAFGIPSRSFTMGSAIIRVGGASIFPSITSGLRISGEYVSASIGSGTTTLSIDLVAGGVISGIRGNTSTGTGTGQLSPGLLVKCTFTGSTIQLIVDNSGSPTTADIAFCIEI